MIKYALFPGHVTSKTDGDVHFVGAQDLARLYGVNMRECVVLPFPKTAAEEVRWQEMYKFVVQFELIKLRPQYDGDYRLEKCHGWR